MIVATLGQVEITLHHGNPRLFVQRVSEYAARENMPASFVFYLRARDERPQG